MERVGNELQNTAFDRRASADDLDQFGRSAFNRYYYATFLEVREMLRRFNPAWRGSHAQVPDELEGSIAKRLAAIKRTAQRLDDHQGVAICQAARGGLLDLAQLMRGAYVVRVKADYEPEIRIALDSIRFSLDSTSINDAHNWLYRARNYIQVIDRARELSDAY